MPASPDLAAFIRDQFRSVWALELLIFLMDHPDTAWRDEQLIQALRASAPIVSASRVSLVAGGLMLCDGEGGARYAPATADLRQLAEDTRELYALKPDAVRRLIMSSGGAGLSAFADSFRLRRD